MAKRIPVWGRKVKLLSRHDLDEIEKFREYLGDLHSEMPRKKFAKKWRDYLGLSEIAQEALRAKELANGKERVTGHHRRSHNGACEPDCYYETKN
jgi:hypothetical protein